MVTPSLYAVDATADTVLQHGRPVSKGPAPRLCIYVPPFLPCRPASRPSADSLVCGLPAAEHTSQPAFQPLRCAVQSCRTLGVELPGAANRHGEVAPDPVILWLLPALTFTTEHWGAMSGAFETHGVNQYQTPQWQLVTVHRAPSCHGVHHGNWPSSIAHPHLGLA